MDKCEYTRYEVKNCGIKTVLEIPHKKEEITEIIKELKDILLHTLKDQFKQII